MRGANIKKKLKERPVAIWLFPHWTPCIFSAHQAVNHVRIMWLLKVFTFTHHHKTVYRLNESSCFASMWGPAFLIILNKSIFYLCVLFTLRQIVYIVVCTKLLFRYRFAWSCVIPPHRCVIDIKGIRFRFTLCQPNASVFQEVCWSCTERRAFGGWCVARYHVTSRLGCLLTFWRRNYFFLF